MLAISLLALIALGVIGVIVGISGLLRNRAKSINGLPSRKKVTGASIRKFVKERQWGIALLAIFGVSSIAIGVASNLGPGPTTVNPQTPTPFNGALNLQASGSNANLTRTGYAVTLSQYGAPRLFDFTYRGLQPASTTGSVWGLSVNQMRFAYYGMDDQWHETSFQLNEEGWKWIANGSISYTNAGTRPNTLLEEMQWADGFVSSQFSPDLPSYYYPDGPTANHNVATGGSYGGILPIDNNATQMMDNWPEFHQTQAMEAWAGGTPTNNSQVRGAVDHDDQLVFLAQNGQKVATSNWYRPDAWPRRTEIDIVDPVDNGHSWVYLYFNPTTYATQPTPRNSISADYCRTDSYIAPGEASSVNWNPTTDMIVATNYQMQMNPSNAADFLNLKITVPGVLQTDILQEFPKDFIWADGRLNFGGTTSLAAVRVGLGLKYGVCGTWYAAASPGLTSATTSLYGSAAATTAKESDVPLEYNDVHAHVGVFYNRGNPDQTKHPSYGEPPYTTATGAMGWMDGTGAKTPVYYNFPTGPALGTSPSLGPLAVREQWTNFAGAYEANTATDYAGYCFNDSAYWVYTNTAALAAASGTTINTWNPVLSPFQNNLGLDGGSFNDKAAIINGPVMAYISRISCLRVVINLGWLHGLNAALYGVLATTNPGAGYVEGFEYYTQQDLAVFPNAFYQYNISYPVPQLPGELVSVGASLDHMWAYFNVFQVARGIETVAPGTSLYIGQGVANDSSTPALTQMSAAMNMLSNSVAGRAFVRTHGFPSFTHIQQLAADNTAFVYNSYPMWSWATNVSKAAGNTATSDQGCTVFPKTLTYNNNSADDVAQGYTSTNTMGRAGFSTGTGMYHPWWDTDGAAPNQEQWIDVVAWRDTEIFNQNGGQGASQTTHGTDAQATPFEMIPVTARNTANTNVAPDWAILHVPNAGDVWVYMPQRETGEIKSAHDGTWQPPHATADDTALAFKDNSTNVRTKIGVQEFGLFDEKLALGNSVIPYTVAMVFGNFNITSQASANIYGKREWVRNRLQLSLIFTLVGQVVPQYIVTSFAPTNHGLFYKTGDVVNMTVLTDYPGTGSGIPAMTTAICTGLNGYTTAPVISNGGVGVLVGTINGTRNEYRYTIQFTITSVPAEGDNVGLTLGTRHDFYYASVTGSATYVPNATCGIFFDHTAPAAATFSLPATTRSTAVTIDWTAHPGMDNSDGTLKDGSGNPLSGIANYTVLRNGVPVATITGPGNGGTTFSYVDTNGGSAFTNGQVLEYCLLTSDMAGNVGTSGTVQTTISLPFTPGAFDAMIPSASSVPFQLRWVNNPGSGIITGYSILRSLTVSNSYTMIATLASTVRSWTQSFGTGNASLINADDTYWYILQSTNGATTINNTPISVIRDTTAPNPASILPLTSPYKPTTYTIPIDITGPGKAIDPGFYSTGDLSNVGSGVAIYTVWRCVNPGTGWQVPVNRGTVTPGIIESNVWYDVDPGLVNMYSYKYWVTSTDNAGNTVNSTAIQFTFSTANINPAGALKILQVTTNVTTCQRGRWIGYIVKLQNIGSLSTTINTLPVAVLFGGIDETSQYTIYGNFTADATINAYATRYYLFRIRPSAGADLGRVLINATTTWSLVNKDWSKQPASVTIQATMIDLIPAAPPLVIAMGRNMQVELKWVVPASNGGSAITNYRIYQGTTPGGETLLATVGNMLTFTSTALTNGQMYYFKISAVNCVGESDTSPETSAIPAVVPSTPVGLTATTVNMQVILKWEPPISNGSAAVTSYRIYRGTSPGNETFLMAIGNVTTYTATELTYGQVYYFHVSAMNTLGESPPSNEVSAYLVTVPSAPTGLSLVPGAKQIVLNWVTPASNGGATITNYHIYQGTSSNNETLLATIGSYTTYTSTGLANGQVYFYQVTAMSVAGESARSIEANTTTATVPGVPTALTATRGNAQVVLNWVAPTSNGGTAITSYSIYCGTLSSSVSLLATIGNITTYTSTGLANGQIYYYEVTAVNVAGESVKSAEASATPATVPGAPTGLALTPSNAQIVLNWVAPASDGGSAITGYNVYRSLTSGTETLLISLSVVLTYTNVGLTNGQIYYYVVTAVNAMGESVKSAETGAKPVTVPGALTGLLLTPGNAQIVLIWDAPSNNGGSAITNYRIYRGTSSGFETLLTTLGVVLTYTNTGLTNGQLYYYQVSAMNAMGEGARSSEASVWPQAAPTPPSAPTRLTATPGNSIVLLNWSTPASNGGSVITGYCVYQGKTWGTETLMMTISVVLACTSGVLTNGQVYYFQVSAVNAVGEGPRSDEANAMPRTVPEAPRNLKATSGDKQAVLSWQEPISNGGLPIVNYTIYRGTSKDNKILLAIIDNRTSYTDINVINGQVYYYEIHAANEAGEGTTSNEAQVIPANPTVFDYSRINPISNSILVLTISLLGIGAVISISTIVIARKLKIKHKPPTTVSAIATASTRSATSTIISMQPLAGTSADRQAGISAHVPLEAGPTENKIYNVALESCPITPSIMSSINVDAPFSVGAPEINHVTERSVLLVSQADLHALDEIKVSLESTRMAVRCNSCNPHEDTKLVPFNEKILLACKKCMQPVTVVVKCVNCFGGFTITQDELYSTRDARFQCPICREITNIMQ